MTRLLVSLILLVATLAFGMGCHSTAKPMAKPVVDPATQPDKLLIREVRFPGTKILSPQQLAGLLVTEAGANTVSGPYDGDAIQSGIMRILAQCYEQGLVDARVGHHSVQTTDGKLLLVVPIEEGAQYRLGRIDVKGALAAPAAAYLQVLTLRTGEVFSRNKVQEEIRRLEAFHAERTSQKVKVTPMVDIDLHSHVVNIDIEIGEH